VAWWVTITPEVLRGIQTFGFRNPSPDKILEFVECYLSQYGEECATNRWSKCPVDFFVYTHLLIHDGRFHTLEFVVNDTSKEVGVLRVVWVEHYPGDIL
jgi:hypothetical protein